MTAGVYLIHLDDPLCHARHYLGASKDIPARLEAHRQQRGAKMLAHANTRGLRWHVERVWYTDTAEQAYRLEAKMKRHKHNTHYCPKCGGRR